MNNVQVLIDSDAFIGWMLERDPHHQHATHLFEQLKSQHIQATTNSLVVAETATVLSHASGQALANLFLQKVFKRPEVPVIFVDEKLYEAAIELFTQQSRRGTSVTDCANVVVMQQFEIPKIFSFDKVYQKDFALKSVEDGG